jgi:hypothetical protein
VGILISKTWKPSLKIGVNEKIISVLVNLLDHKILNTANIAKMCQTGPGKWHCKDFWCWKGDGIL